MKTTIILSLIFAVSSIFAEVKEAEKVNAEPSLKRVGVCCDGLIAFDGRIESLTLSRNQIIQFSDGTIKDLPNSWYYLYRPFVLKKGEVINFHCGYVSDKVSILSEVTADGTYRPLIQGTGAKIRKNDFTYIADRDIHLILNCYDIFSTETSFTIYRQPENAVNYPSPKSKTRIPSPLWSRLMQGVVKVAYSQTGIEINTKEQYLSASLLGYDAQKADMELTKDNQIVMCHDRGVTLNEQGRSIRYDRKNNIPIRSMTRDEFCAIEYEVSLYQYGYYPKHTDLDSYLRICKETHVIPYLTIRNHLVDETLPVLQKTLQKYCLQDNCIISSFPPNIENIIKCKRYLPNAAYIYVQHFGAPMTKKIVDQAKILGNILIQIECTDSMVEQSQEAIQYANRCGVPWGSYILSSMERYTYLVSRGCSMMQIYAPAFKEKVRRLHLPLQLKDGQVSIKGSFGFGKQPSYTATIAVDKTKQEIKISKIAYLGSKNQIPDALLNIWITKLPILVQALGKGVSACWIDKETKQITIRMREMPAAATIDLLIEI